METTIGGKFENYFNERPYKTQYFGETKFEIGLAVLGKQRPVFGSTCEDWYLYPFILIFNEN